MSFLRRILGGNPQPVPAIDDADASGTEPDPDATPAPGGSSVADEQARDRELLRDEARRLDDELIQRQLRYADRSWTPPAQGGDRRADDEDAKRSSRG